MKFRIALTILAFICCSMTASFCYAEPQNLSLIKQELIKYHDTGKYEQELTAVIQKAYAYLQEKIKKNQQLEKPHRLAIVFDIDETVLSNYRDIKQLRFGGTKQMVDQRVAESHAQAIIPSLNLFRFAKQNNITVFFITGRKESLRKATVENLHKVGFDGWMTLFLKPNADKNLSNIPFKIHSRESIERQGFDIVANIGDQWSDFKGGHAEKTFKMPNPYYYVP